MTIFAHGYDICFCGESKDNQKGWYFMWVPALNLSNHKSFTREQYIEDSQGQREPLTRHYDKAWRSIEIMTGLEICFSAANLIKSEEPAQNINYLTIFRFAVSR